MVVSQRSGGAIKSELQRLKPLSEGVITAGLKPGPPKGAEILHTV
jgi:hypothetical protein